MDELPPGPWKAMRNRLGWVSSWRDAGAVDVISWDHEGIDASPEVIAAIEALPILLAAARKAVAADTFGEYVDAHNALGEALALIDRKED